MKTLRFLIRQVFLLVLLISCSSPEAEEIHVYDIKEIVLEAENEYENPYTDVVCWVELEGPGFNKRIYGFWDGGQTFRVRVAATSPGTWKWTSGSDSPADGGLNGKSGSFQAIPWTEKELLENPNRRGFIRATPNGHALQYADGTPFFFIGDTWWAASTWRYPLTGEAPRPDWVPGPEGLSFENVIHYRQKQGYNSLAMIACYPNWKADEFPPQVEDENGIGIRQAWDHEGVTAKAMHDENGNLPFEISDKDPLADYDKINPAYFQSLDKKMDYLASVGFIPFLETVRRDHGPSWKEYYEWPGSFSRFIHYIASRYGAHNFILSPIHLDWMPPVHGLKGYEFNEAIMKWYEDFGKMPFGQPVTSLIDSATHSTFGVGDSVAWLTMHSVGNRTRNHGFYPLLEEQFNIDPPLPTANLEPYYPGWNQFEVSIVAGESPVRGSERDNYFGRVQAWGSFLSGGLSGHIYGTGAYDGTTVGEERGYRPYIWEALKYPAGEQVGYLRKFVESEGAAYQDLLLASGRLIPRESPGSHPYGLDGWSFMMWLPDKSMVMLFFENKCKPPLVTGLVPGREYVMRWFDTITGEWIKDPGTVKTDEDGSFRIVEYPDGTSVSTRDWALKLNLVQE